METLVLTMMMTIVLGSGSSVLGSGSRRTTREESRSPGCGSPSVRLRGGEWGRLTSPRFPLPYPSSTDCRWLLTADPPNATLLVWIESLDLEEDARCSLDYLQVHAGSSALAPPLGPPLCGRLRDTLLRSDSSPTLLLLFHSDPTHQDKGFVLRPFAQSTTLNGCPEFLLKSESGSLRSPGFPGPYPDGVDCWTLIRVPSGRRVTLTFGWLDLEHGGDNCTFDYVRLWDGRTPASPPLGVFCSSAPPKLSSSSDSLLLHFHSDASVAGRGYNATYTSHRHDRANEGDCLWRRSGEGGGVVASPGHPSAYPSGSRCSVWLVAPGEGARVRLHLEALQMEMEPGCPYDFLQVEEPRGGGNGTEVLGRFCGNEGEPANLTSTGNQVRIVFQSDDFGEFSGFRLRYSFESQDGHKTPPVQESEHGPDANLKEEQLEFIAVPLNATLEVGSSHTMRCATRTPAQITWWKDGAPLEGVRPLPGLRRLPDDTLWIRSAEESLSGHYACVARSPAGREVTAQARLDLRKKDPACGIVFRRRPSDASLPEGVSFHLECLAAGRRVRVRWLKDGRPLEQEGTGHVTVASGGALLLVEGAGGADAGVYECVAREGEEGACERSASALVRVMRSGGVEEVCGRSSADPSSERPPEQSEHGKIVGGRDARRGAHPWQAMLWEPSLGSFCGGTLLNERWLATAAHCFVNYRNLRWERVVVRLGGHDRLAPAHQEAGEVRTGVADSSSVVVHPAYDRNTFDNDLALLRLRDPVAFTDTVAPACLGDDESLLQGGGRWGTVVGWGKLKEDGPSPRHLQEIRLPVVDQETCRASTNYTVTRNMFCAGYAQEILGDACQGDSGGPFLVRRSGRWHLVGVVSWGEGCGARDKYGFYTRLPNYGSWIRAIIKS